MTPAERWRVAEALFRDADAHKPEEARFVTWSDEQEEAFQKWDGDQLDRALVFYPTGKGKSKLCLGLMYVRGEDYLVVVAPLKTHGQWKADAATLGITVRVETPHKFRMENSKYRKTDPFIIDEYHELGGHTAKGFRKFNRMAARLEAPIIMASATPNYNDAERVFCITAVGRRNPNRNYKQWLYQTCITRENPFSVIPYVDGFLEFDSAADYLLNEPYVMYIPDEAEWTAEEIQLPMPALPNFYKYGYNHRRHEMVSSLMGMYHQEIDLFFIDDEGLIRSEIREVVLSLMLNHPDREKWLVFCSHQTVAQALYRSTSGNVWLIDGDTKNHDEVKKEFIEADEGWLIGTTALATGVDGIDKTCHSLLLLDDIRGDNAKRRQLIGRILPRGNGDDAERLVVTAHF